MKKIFGLMMVFSIFLFNNAAYAQSSNCPIQVVPMSSKVVFLQDTFLTAIKNACSTNVAAVNSTIANLQIVTAQSNHLPSLSLSSTAGINNTATYADFNRTNSADKYLNNYSASLAVSEKLWSGGVDSLGVKIASLKYNSNTLEEIIFRETLQANIVKEIVKLLNTNILIIQKEKELEQWKLLNGMTQQKAKGGHLNQRDVLQSNKEFASAEAEVENLHNSLTQATKVFSNRFGLNASLFERSKLMDLEKNFALIFGEGKAFIKDNKLSTTISSRSSDIKKTYIQKQMANVDLEQKRILSFSPEVRLTAEVKANYIDNGNRTTYPRAPTLPNWSLSPGASLGFSMSLYNPRALSQVDEQLANIQQIHASEGNILQNIALQRENWLSDLAVSENKLVGVQRVLDAINNLVKINKRLFDAGLLNMFDIIRGMQDEYAQERTILDLNNQIRTTCANAFVAVNLGIIQ